VLGMHAQPHMCLAPVCFGMLDASRIHRSVDVCRYFSVIYPPMRSAHLSFLSTWFHGLSVSLNSLLHKYFCGIALVPRQSEFDKLGGSSSPYRSHPTEESADGHVWGLTPSRSTRSVIGPGAHRAGGSRAVAPRADVPQSRCPGRRAPLARGGPGRGLGPARLARPPGAPGVGRTGAGGGLGAAAPHGAPVSETRRDPGGPAARRGVEGASRRPGPLAPPPLGRHAGRTGPRGHAQSRVCPSHAQKTGRQPGQTQPWVMPPQATAEVGGALAAGLEVSPPARLIPSARTWAWRSVGRHWWQHPARPCRRLPGRQSASRMRRNARAPPICGGGSCPGRGHDGAT
jgi:hypothetical protein